MFKHIKTSKDNKEVVSYLSRKLSLGTENIIARIAYTYSLSKDVKLNLSDIKDAQGKEYTKGVLFGDKLSYYVSILCVHYGFHYTNPDIPKYIKMHIDDGLNLINAELKDNPNLDGFEFIIDKIDEGLSQISMNA